jgi:hypothetical protein
MTQTNSKLLTASGAMRGLDRRARAGAVSLDIALLARCRKPESKDRLQVRLVLLLNLVHTHVVVVKY